MQQTVARVCVRCGFAPSRPDVILGELDTCLDLVKCDGRRILNNYDQGKTKRGRSFRAIREAAENAIIESSVIEIIEEVIVPKGNDPTKTSLILMMHDDDPTITTVEIAKALGLRYQHVANTLQRKNRELRHVRRV